MLAALRRWFQDWLRRNVVAPDPMPERDDAFDVAVMDEICGRK